MINNDLLAGLKLAGNIQAIAVSRHGLLTGQRLGWRSLDKDALMKSLTGRNLIIKLQSQFGASMIQVEFASKTFPDTKDASCLPAALWWESALRQARFQRDTSHASRTTLNVIINVIIYVIKTGERVKRFESNGLATARRAAIPNCRASCGLKLEFLYILYKSD